MAEDMIKGWLNKYRLELNLGTRFENAFLKLSEWDRENIDTKYNSYPAGMAYVACLMSGEERTQEQISKIPDLTCSTVSLQKRYRQIKARNNRKIIDFIDGPLLVAHM
jgi:transcription initiation factor TFIIIB Brf1 subunit/transcription initiation factor TFIIB